MSNPSLSSSTDPSIGTARELDRPVVERGAPLYPVANRRHRIHRGLLTARQEHIFNWTAVVVVLLYATAWVGAVDQVREARARPAFGAAPSAVSVPSPSLSVAEHVLGSPPVAMPFLTEAMLGFLHPLRGESGEVRFAPALPGEELTEAPSEAHAVIEGSPRADFSAPERSGIYKFAVEINKATKAIEDLSIITLVPRSAKQAGRIGPYYLGNWPWESGGTPKSERYAPPSGFIEVTRENQDFLVSEHFRLRDFLTKDQLDVWPKYLLLDPRLIDKLELTIQELQRSGVKVEHVTVMSGFRTPRYNHSGGTHRVARI